MKAKAWRLYGASDLRLEDVELAAAGADGVVVGSAFVSACTIPGQAAALVRTLRAGCAKENS